MWVLRGLRDGVLTTRWPARPDEYAAATRGPAMVLAGAEAVLAGSAAEPVIAGPAPGQSPATDVPGLCPVGAISAEQGGRVRVDQGSCIQCGRCVRLRPDAFGWSAGAGSAALTRAGLVVPADESPDALAAVTDALRDRTRALRRSVHLRHVDAGSDGSEEWEIMALLNPVYDIHRLGMFFTASPRHADVLLVTGAGANGMADPLRETYEAMPHPKVVVAVGTDAVGGGIVSPSYATSGGIGDILPVDVWLPGSPPSPFAILSALLLALGRLPARARSQTMTTTGTAGGLR
jgi:Ni,Fe-hydrogenase III small subunit/ferredoxin